MAVMGQVWGIGTRRLGRDWNRRLWLFGRLVWTVMGYGVEIWGWKERKKMEKVSPAVQVTERYLRWVMGVDWVILEYMVREEVQRMMLREKGAVRAWGWEMGMEEGRGSELARRYWDERERERER